MPDATLPPHPRGRFASARLLAGEWGVFALRGAVALLFGVLTLVMPAAGLALLLAGLAAWLAIDGIATLYQAVRGPKERHRLALWIDGVLSVVAAALLLFLPMISAIALVIVFGAWAVVAGVARIIMAFRTGSWLLGLFGAVTVLLGVWLLVAPGPGLLALIWLVGFQAIVAGGLLLAMAWRLRRIHHDPHGPGTTLAA